VASEEWSVEYARRRSWIAHGRVSGTVDDLRPILEALAVRHGVARATRGGETLVARSEKPGRKAYFGHESES
jgi:hypothetical protein